MKTKSNKLIIYRYVVERHYSDCWEEYPPNGRFPGVFTTTITWQKHRIPTTNAYRKFLILYLPPAKFNI